MKKSFLLFLPFLLLVASVFVSCEEVQEESKYDNWQPKNAAFIDSIKTLTGENYVTTVAQADKMELGKLYAINTEYQGSNLGNQYVYCKKLVANKNGERPLFSGANSTVSAYYYGTFYNGDEFDGNFDGYSAIDRTIPIPPVKEPTVFNSPSTFSVTGVILGWTWALQYMRTGERWMLYVPYQSAYGSGGSDSGSIPGYTALTFDLILESIVE